MLYCPAYAHERWALMQQVKKLHKPIAMEILFGILEMAREVAKYIRAMN